MANTIGSRPTSRGVRKVNEHLVQEGRALIITEANENNYSWEDIPNGSIKVDSQNGLMFLKLQGQSTWVPANIIRDNARDVDGNLIDNSQNGYTIAIAKDAIVCRENYTISSIDQNTKTFEYKDAKDQTYTGNISERGYHFELHEGHYPCGRNMLEVIIDDCLYRSAASGGLIEQSETKFILTETPVVGMELTVKYIKLIRIGNPYPRVFLRRGEYDAETGIDSNGEPEDAEIGDVWLDFAGDPEKEDGYLGEVFDNDRYVPWYRITGYPETVAQGKATGLLTDAAVENHTHNINNLPGVTEFFNRVIATKVNNAIHADQSDNSNGLQGRVTGYKANNIPYLDSSGKLPKSIIPMQEIDVGAQISNATINASQVSYSDTMNVRQALDWLVANLSNLLIPPGTIVAYNGTTAPEGWAICNGQNGTPDLRGRFLRGADGAYGHGTAIAAGLPNIKGSFAGNDLMDDITNPVVSGPFGTTWQTGLRDCNDGSRGTWSIDFDASKCNSIYGNSNTVMPTSWATTYIMKL